MMLALFRCTAGTVDERDPPVDPSTDLISVTCLLGTVCTYWTPAGGREFAVVPFESDDPITSAGGFTWWVDANQFGDGSRVVVARAFMAVIDNHSSVALVGLDPALDVWWDWGLSVSTYDAVVTDDSVMFIGPILGQLDPSKGVGFEIDLTGWDISVTDAAASLGFDGCDVEPPRLNIMSLALDATGQHYYADVTGVYRFDPVSRFAVLVAPECDFNNTSLAVTPDGDYAFLVRRWDVLRVDLLSGVSSIFYSKSGPPFWDVAVHPVSGEVFAVSGESCIFRLDGNDEMTTYAGDCDESGDAAEGASLSDARFGALMSIAIDFEGHMYVVDVTNDLVRVIPTLTPLVRPVE